MKAEYLVFLCLFLTGLLARFVYERMKLAGRVNLKNKLLFAAIFTVMVTMWTCWFAMCPLDTWMLALPGSVRWIGLAFFLLGLFLAIGAFVQLRGVEDIDHLVTTGLFSKIRHPMYTGFVCWILGWGIYHGAGLSLVVGSIGIANILYWRRLEDMDLTSRYGETYREYREKTWF